MPISWNIPALINKIATDIPGLNTLLKALLKWDVSGTEDIPTDAKRMADVTGGKQLQIYDGSSWGSAGKLMHDVDMLDGKHAATGQTADTIPVRDANGAIPGNITGNAATATEASSLANDYVVPVANGGTGANTEAGARQSLGTNNGSNITTGVVGTGVGGTGRTDGMVTDVMLTDYNVSAKSVGELGPAAAKDAISPDTLTVPGIYMCTNCTSALGWPWGGTWMVQVKRNGANVHQTTHPANGFQQLVRWSTNSGASWTRWYGNYSGNNNYNIYLAKDGADTNTGLSADSPLLTVGAALQQATGIGSFGYIVFHFGPGDWGNVSIYANAIPATQIYIYPITGGTSATDPGNTKPTFGTLTLVDGVFTVGNIEANQIYASRAFVNVRYYNKFNRVWAELCSYVAMRDATAVDIKYDSAGTGAIFTASVGSTINLNEAMTLESGLANSGFAAASTDYGAIFIGNNFSCTGTLSSQKFWVNKQAHMAFYGVNKSYLDFPGTGYTANGGVSTNGVPWHAGKITGNTGPTSSYVSAVKEGGALVNSTTTNFGSVWNAATKNYRVACATYPASNDNVYLAYSITKANADSDTNITNNRLTWDADTGALAATSFIGNLNMDNAASGTLAVARGGTGSTTKNFVDLSSDQTVGGTKTFTSNVWTSGNGNMFMAKNTNFKRGTAPSAAQYPWIIAGKDNAGNTTGGIYMQYGTDKAICSYLMCYSGITTDNTWSSLRIGYTKDGVVYTWAPTPAAGSNDNNIATTAWVNTNGYGFKAGDFVFSYLSSKTGFLLCNGAAVSRTTYSALYGVIGTKFGTGNGSTTFNLPDFRGKFAEGANSNLGSVLSAGLPNATGALNALAAGPIWQSAGSGALYNNYSAEGTNGYQFSGSITRSSDRHVRLDLSKSNSIYGGSSTVQPPAICLNVFIKY